MQKLEWKSRLIIQWIYLPTITNKYDKIPESSPSNETRHFIYYLSSNQILSSCENYITPHDMFWSIENGLDHK